jgi:hypothetical protein
MPSLARDAGESQESAAIRASILVQKVAPHAGLRPG